MGVIKIQERRKKISEIIKEQLGFESSCSLDIVRDRADKIDWNVLSSNIPPSEIEAYIQEFSGEVNILHYSLKNGIAGMSPETIKRFKNQISWYRVIKEGQMKKKELLEYKDSCLYLPGHNIEFHFSATGSEMQYLKKYGPDKHFLSFFDKLSTLQKEKFFKTFLVTCDISRANQSKFLEIFIDEDFVTIEILLNNPRVNPRALKQYFSYFYNKKEDQGQENAGVDNFLFLGDFNHNVIVINKSIVKRKEDKEIVKNLIIKGVDNGYYLNSHLLLTVNYYPRIFERTIGKMFNLNFRLDPLEDDEFFADLIKKRCVDTLFFLNLTRNFKLGEKTKEACLGAEVAKANPFNEIGQPQSFKKSISKDVYKNLLTFQDNSPELEKRIFDFYFYESK